jgi:2-keto-3-deoxy-L-arabinonate dehydratase
MTRPLAGVIPVIVTPFAADDSIDYAALERQVEFLIEAGCDWLSIGFGSEVARLSSAELGLLLRQVVRFGAGRIGVIGNAEITGIQPGEAAVDRVAQRGGDLAMVRPAALEDIDQEALFDTIATVAARSAVPLIVQDAPQATFVSLAPQTIARLLTEVGNVVAAKVEPMVSVPKIEAVVAALHGTEATILGGLGGRFYLEELAAGSRGTMPGPAYPELLAAAGARYLRGDRSGGYALIAQSLPLGNIAGRNMDVFRYLQKHLLVRRGVLSSARLRTPHAPIPDRVREEIDEMMEALNLLTLLDECVAELTATAELAGSAQLAATVADLDGKRR